MSAEYFCTDRNEYDEWWGYWPIFRASRWFVSFSSQNHNEMVTTMEMDLKLRKIIDFQLQDRTYAENIQLILFPQRNEFRNEFGNEFSSF